jgi:phage terminase large subunit
MSSIDDSVHSALEDEISGLSMSHIYCPLKNQINALNGSIFRYAGLSRNLESIKSKHKFDIAWVEEAESVSQKSLDVLVPTIRESGSELWFSFNPDDEFGAVYSTYVKPYLDTIKSQGYYEDEELYVCQTSLDDNPFAPEELVAASAKMKRDDYKKWLHIYGGEVFGDYQESIIQPEWIDAAIDAHLKLGFKPLGVKSQGFDLADMGDAKCVMHRHGSVITNGKLWSHGELPQAIDIAFEETQKDRSEFMVYDDDGLGKSMKVYLANVTINKGLTVVPYNGNGALDEPHEIYADGKTNRNTFRNKRAQYYWRLRDRFEATYNVINNGIYADPDSLISISSDLEDLDVLKSELVKIRRKKGQNAFIQIESKEDMRKRGVKSPNMADALKMCFANPAPEPDSVDLDFTSEF